MLMDWRWLLIMDKIYRRSTQLGNSPKRKKDEKRRKRNVIMNFRVSADEKAAIDRRIEASGLTKSKFFIESCMYQKVLVKGNIRTFSKIREEIRNLKFRLDDENELKIRKEDAEAFRMIAEILERITKEGECN